jgi:hypothetical protein
MRMRNLKSETSARRWLPAAAFSSRALARASTFSSRALARASTFSSRALARASTIGMVGALSSALAGCPNQELAPLTPCTVSGVSIEVPQTGVDKVDLLFMIDNSGSMAEEQKKLAAVLPDLVTVLATGQLNPNMPKERPDFPPVKSLHIGVISSDLGVNLAPDIASCGGASYDPTAPDPANTAAAVQMMAPNNVRLNKPFGDNGQLLTSTLVAQAGIWSRPFGTTFSTPVEPTVPGDARCAQVQVNRFIDFTAGTTNPEQTKLEFSCIAKLGKNGCGLEQQLESAYKALAPSNVPFSRDSRGQGSGGGAVNNGFLRDDAVLAVVFVTDEEDCSIPDKSSELFNRTSSMFMPGDINTRCGKPENQQFLLPTSRYVDGLRALKSEAFQDRIIVAGIVGIPLSVNLGGEKAHSGKANLDAILARGDMQFMTRPSNISTTDEEPVPTCTSPNGDGTAAPARRFLETISNFGDNGVVTSICEDEYGSALQAVITKIAAQLSGACLPRQLRPVDGKVECDVVEIRAPNDNTPCEASKGRTPLPARRVNNTVRTVCGVNQVAVMNGQLMGGEGWYYDNFSPEVKMECTANPQRIAFTANAQLLPGAQARFECFQPVAPGVDSTATGRDAVNKPCTDDAVCQATNDDKFQLICITGGCQIACQGDANCPLGWHCVADTATSRQYCVNPTCPPAIATE